MRTLLKKDLAPYFLNLYKTLQTPDERKTFLELYSYFISVEQSLGIKLEPNDYSKIIDLGKFKSKQDINRVLFLALHNETANNANTNLLGLTREQLTALSNQYAARNSDIVNRLIQNIKDLEANIAQYTRYVDNYCSQLFTAKNQLSAMSVNADINDRIVYQFDLILKNNDFNHVYYDTVNKILHAVTATDCILHDVNDDVNYNFGKFDIVYDFMSNHIHVLPFANNLTSTEDNQFIHPHLFRHKDMCFGSAQASVVECKKAFEIAKIYTICNMILHEYNPASPTLLINKFNQKYTMNGYKHIINDYYNLHFHKLLTDQLAGFLPETDSPISVDYIPEPNTASVDEVEAA